MSLYGVIGYHVTLSEGQMIANHPIYGVLGYHVTLSEGQMIANHPIYGVLGYHVTLSEGHNDSQSPHIRKHLCPILWQLWFIRHKIIHTI